MNRMTYLTAIAAMAALHLGGPAAHAATLSSLLGGGSLTEGDVVFDNFFFDDVFTAPDRTNPPLAGDRAVDASEIDVSASSTPTSVTLKVEIAPAISISGQDANSNFEHIFNFFLDFTVGVLPPSSREITDATLGSGDLFATGDRAFSEVVYAPGGFGILGDRLEIFEARSGTPTSQETDTQTISAISPVLFEGRVLGETFDGASSGLSTFSLTFDLSGTAPPPPNVVPLPASVVLLLAGLGGLGLVARRRRA